MNSLSRPNPTSDKEKKSRSTCFNLMEVFVKREIFAQLKKLPVNTARHLQPGEIATYALNRLPSLYASSEEGKAYQLQKAREFQEQIRACVLQGIAAVLRDPLRKATPLSITHQDICSEAYFILIFLERFVKKRGGQSQKLTVGELETQILVSLDDYDVALAELEDFLRKEGLCNETLTAQNMVSLVKKALRKSSPSSSTNHEEHQSLNERESEILAYHGGDNDDELSDFASHLRDWYKD
jgi:hypothetical protein